MAAFFTFEARRILVVGAMANVFETPFAFVTRTESVDSVLITPWNAIDFCAFTLVWLVVLVGCDAAEAMLTAPAVRPTLSKLATATRPKVPVLDSYMVFPSVVLSEKSSNHFKFVALICEFGGRDQGKVIVLPVVGWPGLSTRA